jgi:hypothetical protein
MDNVQKTNSCMDSSSLGYGPVVDFYEDGNEPLGFESFYLAEQLLAS